MPETIGLLEPKTSERETTVTLSIDRLRPSGFVIKPMDAEAAVALLQSFYDEDPQEQRETFALLKQTIDEGRRERGERLLFEDYD